jgi:hypothetical protein
LDAGLPGFDRFIIAAADTVMERSSASLMAEYFPSVELRRELGEHETLLGSITRARYSGIANFLEGLKANRPRGHRRG